MAYFGESLVGIASEWYMDQDMSRWHIWDDLARDFVRQFQYNIDIAPDKNSLSNLKKKSSESFREYVVKWREQAARVKPPWMRSKWSVFFYKPKRLLLLEHDICNGKPFAEAIKIGEMVENGMKIGRILSQSVIRATSQAIQSGSGGVANRKKKEEVAMAASKQKKVVLKDEEVPNVTNNPLSAYNNRPVIGMICEDEEFDPALEAIIAIADVEKPKATVKQDKGEKKSNSAPPSEEKTVKNKTGAIPLKDVILYVPRAHKKEQLALSPPKRFELNKGPTMYIPKGTYVERGPNYNRAIVTYKGKEIAGEVNETNPYGKYLNLEEVNNAKQKRFPLKRPVSAEEAEEFFRRMKTADYEVINQLQKSPAQVSLLSLLISSNEHQKVLIKTLNEAYVPIETTVEQLERMAERFFTVNQISFSKNELPPEGAAQNKALHLTVKCEGYYVKRVMVDGESGIDICPLSTLQRMKIGTERIRPNNVCVHAFDGIKRDTIGEIDLILTIGPIDFEVMFQVLDMDTSYNFILGRPWIRTARVVPSTLHQMVKFEHEDQEIMVHG
ncbi:uncharacterized protein LOC142178258 [Nicotiana tabacum]|uniref:Uncharacterized protein LOC142178258 n=1 Tax=Nicotiana tabacum TaxID=4097 RepID=A0AC58U2J0_TOBAC